MIARFLKWWKEWNEPRRYTVVFDSEAEAVKFAAEVASLWSGVKVRIIQDD